MSRTARTNGQTKIAGRENEEIQQCRRLSMCFGEKITVERQQRLPIETLKPVGVSARPFSNARWPMAPSE